MGLFFEEDITDLMELGHLLKDRDGEMPEEKVYEFNENYTDDEDDYEDDDE
ncbi:MAG: hypothetical protein ILP19_00545 [Oscillospiraceae bacterium]|nr:hypothetical protein [Oscillospiraceae bacterium]